MELPTVTRQLKSIKVNLNPEDNWFFLVSDPSFVQSPDKPNTIGYDPKIKGDFQRAKRQARQAGATGVVVTEIF